MHVLQDPSERIKISKYPITNFLLVIQSLFEITAIFDFCILNSISDVYPENYRNDRADAERALSRCWQHYWRRVRRQAIELILNNNEVDNCSVKLCGWRALPVEKWKKRIIALRVYISEFYCQPL